MKKLLSLLVIIGMTSLISCNNSAKQAEQEKAQHALDSIKKVLVMDSIAAVQKVKEDSLNEAITKAKAEARAAKADAAKAAKMAEQEKARRKRTAPDRRKNLQDKKKRQVKPGQGRNA